MKMSRTINRYQDHKKKGKHTIRNTITTVMMTALLTTQTSISLAQGPCGLAPSGQNDDFCACFFRESKDACLAAHQPAAFCGKNMIMLQIKANKDHNLGRFCQSYANMRPAGVDNQECVDDMIYVKHHCH